MTQQSKELNEIGIINLIKAKFSTLPLHGAEGIGDDCAIIPINQEESFVITTDTLTEGSHFLMEKITPFDLGYKSLVSNFSDVLAMGAKAQFSFLALTIGKGVSDPWLGQFFDGYRSISQELNAPLLGGDTTTSPYSTTITITAIGRVKNSSIKRRSGAKAGDIIAICRPTGLSLAGLKLILANKRWYSEEEVKAINFHHHPTLLTEESLLLGESSEVTSMMDISDGIAKDLLHILKLSNVKAKIFIDNFPITNEIEYLCQTNGWDPAEIFFTSGEEYSPLITVSRDKFDSLNERYRSKFGRELLKIGVIEPTINNHSIEWIANDKQRERDYNGYIHTR